MTGEQFRNEIGGYNKVQSEDDKTIIQFNDMNRFKQVKARLRIIARATAEDKFILINGIKQAGGLVGMSGDSIADALALKEADVGLCMGSGCEVAKENSDLVIMDNDFKSIQRSIKWGRAIFDNVRKFLQFQMTINISLCFIVLLTGATLGRSPLNVIQLLWTNLIMDILGAIAIGTEPPQSDKVVSSNEESQENKVSRISRKDKVILMQMWRNIFGQVIYQLLVLLVLIYFGGQIFFDETFNLIFEPLRDSNGDATNQLVLNTIVFHTFILMNLFNQINSRVVEENELNVFKTLFNNGLFWLIMGLEFFV
jgi:P-type Ca2+ transporter type 2C